MNLPGTAQRGLKRKNNQSVLGAHVAGGNQIDMMRNDLIDDVGRGPNLGAGSAATFF